MTPRLKKILTKFVAILIAVIDLNSQVVMAGSPMWMGLPPGFVPLASRTNALFGRGIDKGFELGVKVFHAFPYQNSMMDPRGNTELPQQGQTSPEGVVKREERQMDVLRQMEELQI